MQAFLNNMNINMDPLMNDVNTILKSGMNKIMYEFTFTHLSGNIERCKKDMIYYESQLEMLKQIYGENTVVHTDNDTVVHTDNDTVVHTDNDTVVHTDNDTVVHTDNDTVVHTDNDTVVHTDTLSENDNEPIVISPSPVEEQCCSENIKLNIIENDDDVVMNDSVISLIINETSHVVISNDVKEHDDLDEDSEEEEEEADSEEES